MCTTPGCPVLVDAGKCGEHRREADATRGRRQARGYDAEHDRSRAAWAPLVAAGTVTCWRCGRTIDPSGAWDLGHDDHDRSKYRGPEHAACNRAAGGRSAHRR